MILRQAEQIEALEARVDQLMARVDELVAEVAGLKRQLHGSRRERFVAPRSDDELQPPDPETDQAEPRPPRTSRGRRPRTFDPSIPREKVYHPLREEDVPAEIWHHPRARRFYRLVREELELPQRRLRVIEHYQEVIVVDDDATAQSTLQAARVPELQNGRHLVLTAPHPSPLSAHSGFFGCGHFGKANAFLEHHGRGAIDWRL